VALAPAELDARRLVLLGATAWIALSMLTAWLFSPWVRHAAALSFRSHSSDLPDAYPGEVRSVVLSGDSMPQGWLDSTASERVSDLFAGETFDIRLDVISEHSSRYREWIYRLWVGRARLAVGRQGSALVVEVPRRLALLRLHNPALRLDDGVPERAGVPFSIVAGERGRHVWLQYSGDGRTRRADLLLSPTMAWELLVPFNYAFGPEAKVLTMIWVAALLVPLGFWGSRTGRPAASLAVLAVAIAVGLGLIPWLSPAGPVPIRDWLAAVAGVAGGWAARRPAAYLATRCGSPSASEFSSS
jgi:hypothetical protein